jgi:hypothetical protein
MKKLVFLLALLTCLVGLQAQTQLHLIVEANGIQYPTKLTDVRKITFTGGTVSVIQKTGTQSDYLSADFDKITFELRTVTILNESTIDDFMVYPNPTIDVINIKNVPENTLITIYSTTGIKMLSTYSTQINVSSFPTGIYIIQVGNYKTLKFQK